MQGSFEKKVQERLDELKMTPSAPVWDKISLQVTPAKRRRRALFWIPLALLILTGAGWWLWQHNTEFVSENNARPEAVTPKEETNVSHHLSVGNPKEENRDQQQKATPANTQQSGAVPDVRNLRTSYGMNPDLFFGPTQEQKTRNPAPSKDPEITVDTTLLTAPTVAEVLRQKMPKGAIVSTGAEPVPANEPVAPFHQPDSNTSEKNNIIPTIADSVGAKPAIARQRTKWKAAVLVQVGSSIPGNGAAGGNLYASPVQNTGGGFSNNYSYTNGSRGALSYSAGVGIVRNVSRRVQFGVGLQYALYRTQTAVGTFRPLDTTLRFQSRNLPVAGYYTSGSQQEFTNRFGVLEFPVGINYQLFPKVPLGLSATVSYGRLLHSNALTFDHAAGVFYHNRSNAVRNQLALSAALPYTIFLKKDFVLKAGPVLQYHLRSFQEEAGTGTQRLAFAGIKTAVEW